MRIAQVPPLIESVPPKGYGGTERIVSMLTEELVKRGHEVTLFASADSVTEACLVPICPKGLRLYSENVDSLAFHFVQLEAVRKRSAEFDVIHFHNDYMHFPVSRLMNYAHVTTLHGRLDTPGLKSLYKQFSDMPVVSISDNQRLPLPHAFWTSTIYHGLPLDMYKPGKGDGGYLAFLGRISVEKRPDRAIEIARKTGIPLKIAAKVDTADKEYYESIKDLFDHPLIEFVGEIGEEGKEEFLGNASALLFPIDWPEPFGLVMIEAMACGTPVIAFKSGSVPEVIDEGITGYVVSSIDEAVDAVTNIPLLGRREVRRRFEERFDVRIMVDHYENIYSRVIEIKKHKTHSLNLS
jgi:glycosyltransferase involved in cell wall biosynthesis